MVGGHATGGHHGCAGGIGGGAPDVEIRGRARVEPDTDRTFVDEMAKQYMGVDHYPFDRPEDERVVITIIPETVSCPSIPLADDPPY